MISKLPALKGDCNRCGLCCFMPTPEGEMLRCIYLIVTGEVGKAAATACAIHDLEGRNGEKIYLVDKDGHLRGESFCAVGNDDETEVILKQGIGKGCSLGVTDG